MIFSNFDRVRIINLPERRDRRADMIGELKAVGLWGSPKVAFSNATRVTNAPPWRSVGEHGCFLSHLRVLREAVEAGESVLLLEDDCDFTRAARRAPVKADILWGGYVLHQRHIEGAHCMGFSVRALERLVPYLTALLDAPSPPPVDGAYILCCRDNPDLEVVACSPMVAVQRPSDSSITAGAWSKSTAVATLVSTLVRPWKRVLKRRIGIGGQGQDAFDGLIERLRLPRGDRP